MRRAALLRLPVELLFEHVLPHLSLPALGQLMLACSRARSCVLSAPEATLLAAARHTLRAGHPIFTAPSAWAWLRLRQRAAEGFTAGPAGWTWTQRHKPAVLAGARLIHSPSWQHAAARLGGQVLVWRVAGWEQIAAFQGTAAGKSAGRVALMLSC